MCETIQFQKQQHAVYMSLKKHYLGNDMADTKKQRCSNQKQYHIKLDAEARL